MSKTKDPFFKRAIHEAGHGLLCHYLGVIPEELTCHEEKEGGFGLYKKPLDDFGFENATLEIEEKAKSLAMVYIAGREAVLKIQTEAIACADFEFDYRKAKECLTSLALSEDEKIILIQNLEKEVREVFRDEDRWRGVEKLAEELLKNKALSWKEVKSILQQMLLRPRFRIS